MSNLLNAIAQSEQQHQAYSPRLSPSARPVAASRQLSSWLLPALLVAAPVAATLGYSHWRSLERAETVSPAGGLVTLAQEAQAELRAPVMEPQPVMSNVEQAKPVKDEMLLRVGAENIRLLPYPELRTEPLPSLNRQLASHTVNSTPVFAAKETFGAGEQPDVKVISAEPSDNDWNLDELDYSELSPQLAEQLKSAIAATEDEEPEHFPVEQNGSTPPQEQAIKAIAIGDLPASVQNRIPSLNFQTHIYSSTADSRWVKVNDREVFEGDEIAPGVVLRRIEPRHVVFDFESYLVSMPALSEW